AAADVDGDPGRPYHFTDVVHQRIPASLEPVFAAVGPYAAVIEKQRGARLHRAFHGFEDGAGVVRMEFGCPGVEGALEASRIETEELLQGLVPDDAARRVVP